MKLERKQTNELVKKPFAAMDLIIDIIFNRHVENGNILYVPFYIRPYFLLN